MIAEIGDRRRSQRLAPLSMRPIWRSLMTGSETYASVAAAWTYLRTEGDERNVRKVQCYFFENAAMVYGELPSACATRAFIIL